MKWFFSTDDRYWEMLGMLPPACQRDIGFLVGEPYDHGRCTASGLIKPRYTAFVWIRSLGWIFESEGPMTVAEFLRVTEESVLANVKERSDA